MRTRVSTKGQIVIPAEIRDADGIAPGDELEVQRIGRGKYKLVKIERDNAGLVEQLLACPEKGWFIPIDSESTDTL